MYVTDTRSSSKVIHKPEINKNKETAVKTGNLKKIPRLVHTWEKLDMIKYDNITTYKTICWTITF